MHLSHRNIYTAVVTFLLIASCPAVVAQLRTIAIPRADHAATSVSRSQNALARTQETLVLTLPFFDDFSKPEFGLYPDTMRWKDSYSVWVNDGMAIRPPTINVATFDGLDSAGQAYNANDVLLTGYADEMTSQPIDMSEAALTIAERPSVYISFFFQWQGNVEAPDEKDYLELDFKTAEEDGWENVMTIFPKDGADRTIFYDTIMQISGDAFFHDRFQFRFRSFGRLSGPYDTWHVDYVYVNKGRDINDLSFPDRAIASQLGPLFGKYRAMPRDHLFSNEQLTPLTFEIQNMKNEEASVNFRTEGFFSSTDHNAGTTTTYNNVISESTPINNTDGVLFANEHRDVLVNKLPDLQDPQQFPADPGIDSTLIRLTIALQTGDDIFNTTPPVEEDSIGDYTQNYQPIRFATNDTISADYVLSNYYAYDDGIAEFAAGLIEAGNLVAYQFEIDTSYSLKQDTLVAFDIYFPPYAISSNQTVDFFVYHDNDGMPGEQWLRIPSRPVKRKGINEFQRIEFLPALLIDEKKFYIGWREPVAGEVFVGLDISNDTGEKIFVNSNGFWYRNDEVAGSLMIRPVFGSGIIDSSVGVEEQEVLAIYPNPNRGVFYIEGDVHNIEIRSMTGQKILFQSSGNDQRKEIRMQSEEPGLYVLRYRQGNTIRSRKLIIGR